MTYAKGNRSLPYHIVARANGGSNSVSNLCLACEPCNLAKSTQDIRVFLAKKPELLKRILTQAKTPLKDAAAVNATRWALFERLKATGLPVECGSGGRTRFNRVSRGLEKTHWLDAANVGASTPPVLQVGKDIKPLRIKATGHGNRQMCSMDKFGFVRTGPKGAKKVKGYQSGDMVRAVVTKGVKVGTYVGKVAVRAIGSFNITTSTIRSRYIHDKIGLGSHATLILSWSYLGVCVLVPGKYRGLAIVSVPCFINAMAIAIRKERPQFLPGLKARGILAAIG